MNQREAKRHVCLVAAEELRMLVEVCASEFYEELDSLNELPLEDQERVALAVEELICELRTRGLR